MNGMNTIIFNDKNYGYTLSSEISIDTIVVGCEGGMTEDEVALFAPQRVIGFDTPLVLKSESAVCAVASKVLL